ncbi:MAG: NYN domain-containing protein [Planktothrix sp.]
MKTHTAIYWDVQNVGISPENIPLLNLFLNQQGDILIHKAYHYWSLKNELLGQTLYQQGVKTIHVPSGEKNAVDDEIIQDCKYDTMLDMSIKTVILITGDKDFLSLVKELQQLKIKVILISRTNVSQSFKKAVDIAYNIDELIASVKLDQPTPEKLDSPVMIPYEEAKKCLIELIKKVQKQGKKATLAVLGCLIKKHPRLAGYKKVSSIAKPDGKIFAKFGKFVDAVIQEGIIQKNCNGELILLS